MIEQEKGMFIKRTKILYPAAVVIGVAVGLIAGHYISAVLIQFLNWAFL